jgi:hypothetical protein
VGNVEDWFFCHGTVADLPWSASIGSSPFTSFHSK